MGMYPHTHTTPTARKEHECGTCYRTITVGEKYDRDEGQWEGEWVTWKTCRHCSRVFSHIWQVDRHAWDDDYGLDLAEYLREYLRDSKLRALFESRWVGVSPDDLPLDEITAAVRGGS